MGRKENGAGGPGVAQINTPHGNITVEEAIAKMDAAGSNGHLKGECQFACRRKQWSEANKIYHTAVKT